MEEHFQTNNSTNKHIKTTTATTKALFKNNVFKKPKNIKRIKQKIKR